MEKPPLTPWDRERHPASIHPAYKSTVLRGFTKAPVRLPATLSELTGPRFGAERVVPLEADLTKCHAAGGQPLGERIVVAGRVLDENGRPQTNTLLEIWQANAAGRYAHAADMHDAPLDPNFLGTGRCVTDENGFYRFTTVKPGAYPWPNHVNAWRPNHIHFSLFGSCFATRLVTQMYFPGDPLLELDPIFMGVPAAARDSLIAQFSLDLTEEGFALGYRFDIVLRGRHETPMGF